MSPAPRLYVEGKNDLHVIANLLKAHGIDLDPNGANPNLPFIEYAKKSDGRISDVSDLVQSIDSKVRVSEKPVGFVFDSDPHIGQAARWQAVRDRLGKVNVKCPNTIPPEGFVGESTEYKVLVGVWLMPDNQRDGTLETFLTGLIDAGDLLINNAIKAAADAAKVDQRYKDVDRPKAEMYTWLAWQRSPGLPYGVALTSKFFLHDAPIAMNFVKWVRKLYAI